MDCSPRSDIGKGCLLPILGVDGLLQTTECLLLLRLGRPSTKPCVFLTQLTCNLIPKNGGSIRDRLSRRVRGVDSSEEFLQGFLRGIDLLRSRWRDSFQKQLYPPKVPAAHAGFAERVPHNCV